MKKTLLFLMLMFTISIAAQNKDGKSGKIQKLNFPATYQQTQKELKSSGQHLATNEFSQSLRNTSALQQKLQASQSNEAVAQRKAMKTAAADINWNDIGTLSSWNETINFDKENTELIPIQLVDEYGNTTNLLCYPVKFTLAQDELVSMKSSSYNNDFTIYADPQAQQEVAWGYTLWQPFKAGEYYMLISEGGNLDWPWGSPFEATVDVRVLPATALSLPAKQDVSITKDNSFLLVDTYYTLFYKFTLTEDAIVNFGCNFDQTAMGEHLSFVEVDLIAENMTINATNSDLLLKAGVYYVAVYGIFWDGDMFWAEHSAVEAQLDIKTKTLDAPAALSVPFEQDFSLTPNNAYSLFDIVSVLYTLHLESDQMIDINTGGKWSVAIYEPETWKNVKGFYPSERAVVQLSAGDYYVAIGDYDKLYDGTTPVNGHLIVSVPFSYATLDFSETIAVGETKVGDDASLISVITDINYYGIETQNVAAYHFTAQQGHIYKLVMEAYTKAEYSQPTLALFHTPNTGDIYADNIRGTMPYINGTSGTGSLTWQSDVDGDINVMFYFTSPKSDVMFKLTLEELEATHTDMPGTTPDYEDITLPFVSYLHFDPAYNAYWDEGASEYYKLYKLTLEEKTLLTMASGFNAEQGSNVRLKIFTDAERSQQTGQSWGYGEGDTVLLDAGTYYLVMSDSGYFGWNNNYAECLVELNGSADFEELSTITVAQLMDDPLLPAISYTDLPYTDAGYFIYGTSKLITDPAFYISSKFANGYKLTGMSAGDAIHIVNRQPEGESESELRVFQKEENGSYGELAYNGMDWSFGGVTHIQFTANAAGDYYIMASTANSYPSFYAFTEYPSYRVAIWSGEAEDEPATDEVQLPDEVLITSTTATATEVSVAVGATSSDIKLALIALEITATTKTGATVVFENHPLSWEMSGTEASFVIIPHP
jgi:hypothetical protein